MSSESAVEPARDENQILIQYTALTALTLLLAEILFWQRKNTEIDTVAVLISQVSNKIGL